MNPDKPLNQVEGFPPPQPAGGVQLVCFGGEKKDIIYKTCWILNFTHFFVKHYKEKKLPCDILADFYVLVFVVITSVYFLVFIKVNLVNIQFWIRLKN